jgi:DNA-binding transcriptional LysR family regulator
MRRGELDDLVAFATIAQLCSFTRAAAALGVSPSALSHTIRGLETRLGVRLLARTTRSVAPTSAGERLLRSVNAALKEVGTGLAALSDWQGAPTGAIRLTTFSHAAHTVLSSALPKFLLEFPMVSVEVVVDSQLHDLVRDGFDAGIRFGYSVEKDMVAVRIGPEVRSIVVGSPAYFEQHPRPLTPAELDSHSCINYRQAGSGGLMPWDFEKDGKEIRARPKGQLIVDDGYLAGAAILAGAGLGYVLEEYAKPFLQTGRLEQVLDDWCAPYSGLHLYYPTGRVTPALRVLIDSLKWKASDTQPDTSGGLELIIENLNRRRV